MDALKNLKALLDLEGDGRADTTTTLDMEAGATGAASGPASPTALKVDRWGHQRAAELLGDPAPKLADHLHGPADERTAHAVADFHTAAYEPEPVLQEACTDETRHRFIKQMMDSPDYHELHAVTQVNLTASAIATESFAREFGKLAKQEEKELEKQPDPDGPEESKEDKEFKQDMAALRAVGKALKEASKEVGDFQDACNALGIGGDGRQAGKMDVTKVAALYRRIRSNPKIQQICQQAGRFRRYAQGKQRQKVCHGQDELVGVDPAGDVQRLLPVELARLADTDFELDLMRRLAERQALCRQYRGVTPVGKGPIVIVLDESGSMTGDKEVTAKALALTLAWMAKRQKRWCALVAFSGGSEGRVLALPPGKWDDLTLLEWLEQFLDGGTDMDVPLNELPNVYWPKFVESGLQRGRTDIVTITDALVEVPEKLRDDFNAWKKREQARMITLVIRSRAGDLATVSDEVHHVKDVSLSEVAVQDVLAL